VNQISKQYKFKTSLQLESVPPHTVRWNFDVALFQKNKQENIDVNQSAKIQFENGQYRKALRVFRFSKEI